jgi:hypothetical protein
MFFEVFIIRILQCGHTFCEVCIKAFLKSANKECPNCKRKLTELNPNKLIKNFAILELAEEKNSEKPVSTIREKRPKKSEKMEEEEKQPKRKKKAEESERLIGEYAIIGPVEGKGKKKFHGQAQGEFDINPMYSVPDNRSKEHKKRREKDGDRKYNKFANEEAMRHEEEEGRRELKKHHHHKHKHDHFKNDFEEEERPMVRDPFRQKHIFNSEPGEEEWVPRKHWKARGAMAAREPFPHHHPMRPFRALPPFFTRPPFDPNQIINMPRFPPSYPQFFRNAPPPNAFPIRGPDNLRNHEFRLRPRPRQRPFRGHRPARFPPQNF